MAKSSKMVRIKLLRDFWPEADVRRPAGETITVPEAAAKDAINSGLAEFDGVAESAE